MAKNLDLTLLPLYRLSGNELPSPPGLQAVVPPRRPARGREKDRLIVHLTLGGNAPFSTASYLQLTSVAAEEFYRTSGSVTAALRAAAVAVNGDMLERNLELSGQGRYSVGLLILCALRGNQLYVLEAGTTHVYWMADRERVHIHEPALSGRGLGMGQATNVYLSQLPIYAGGRLLLSPKLPPAWEQIIERDNHTAPLEILRGALMRQSHEDENAVLIDVSAGRGVVEIHKPQRQPPPTLEIINKRLKEEPKLPEEPEPVPASHQPEPLPVAAMPEDVEEPEEELVEIIEPEPEPAPQDDVFASIPRQAPKPVSAQDAEPEQKAPAKKDIFASLLRRRVAEPPAVPIEEEIEESDEAPHPDDGIQHPDKGDVLASIPRLEDEPVIAHPTDVDEMEEILEEAKVEIPKGPSTVEVVARQTARIIAKGMQATRAGSQKLKAGFGTMLPRLLPKEENEETSMRLPLGMMGLVAIIIPLIVVTIASVVYFRFGRDIRYETFYTQAEEARERAISQSDPIAERLAWQEVLSNLNLAEERKKTEDTRALRNEAEEHIDQLLGIWRLAFRPAINELPRGIRITRIAANDTELFILDESKGEVLRAYLVGNGYQFDPSFICRPDDYGGKTINRLVEIQILPKSNAMGASVLAFDAQGGLLYCSGSNYPQALSLEAPSVGFRDITAVALQSDVLYVLDALSREVWVYGGQASTFINYPTAFFSTETPSGMEYAVDLSINDTDLYLLFNDGHLATCTYSLLDSVPTRCINPIQLVDTNPAAGGGNAFGEALFTEMHISDPPDAAILLMAGESQSIFRFSPRSYELQNQLKARTDGENALPAIALTALTTNANHVLFIAQDDQVFMTIDAP